MTEQEAIALGNKALACREVLDAAFAKVEAGLIEKLKAVSPARIDDIRGVHACLQNIEAAKGALVSMIAPAQIAKAEQAD